MSTDLSAITGTWQIDPSHSTLGFKARHAMVAKVRGDFSDFSGSLTLDGANPAASSAQIAIVANSLDTKNADRDVHLKSADFLDVEQFPTITFVSTSAKQVSDDEFEVSGDLTIHGVTKPVTVKMELNGVTTDPWGGTSIGFEGKAEVSRKEFGMVWNVALEAGGVLVGDKIALELDVEAVKQ